MENVNGMKITQVPLEELEHNSTSQRMVLTGLVGLIRDYVTSYMGGSEREFALTDDELVFIGSYCSGSLHVRDAIITYGVSPDDVSVQDMFDMMTCPADDTVKRTVNNVLTTNFSGNHKVSDGMRALCALFSSILKVTGLPDGVKAGVYATLAYCQWWNGLTVEAHSNAVEALQYDDEYMLASIIVAAVECGVCRKVER